MVCNLVTYRARSAVREVGYALGFPRPLVDRVAKALETYDSVMVRRDLEADGGFAEFFRRPGEGLPAEALAPARGRRGARLRRRDGPAEHADAARREGAALAPAAEAGGPERAATVRLARGRQPGAGGDPTATEHRDAQRTAPSRVRRCGTPRRRRARPPVGADRAGRPPTDEGWSGRRPRSQPIGLAATRRWAGRGDPARRRGAIRAGGARRRGRPGDTPASVAWLRAGAARATARGRRARPAASPPTRTRRLGPADRAGTQPAGTAPAPGRRRCAPGGDHSLGRARRARAAAAGPRRLDGRPVRLGALARVLRPDRRLPAPPVDPLGRDARDRRAAHRHRAARAGDDGRTGSSSSSTSATSRRSS